MSYFPLGMKPIKLPNHNSVCPICEDARTQQAWIMGSNNLNQMIVRGSVIIENILLESSLSYCPKCDFGYFYPSPPADILERFYKTGGGRGKLRSDESELTDLKSPSSRRDVALAFEIIKECGLCLRNFRGKKILEIGPGLSSYTTPFLELGIEYWANEIGAETSDFIDRVFKAPVIRQPLQDICDSYDKKFDLIFTKDSLEHHPNPAASLRRIKRLLSKDGWLIISVPNLNSYTFKQASITHPYYAYPPHLNYFSKKTFVKYLSQIGLEKIEARTFSFPGEVFYCMELCIKLGMIAPDFQTLKHLTDSDQNERLMIVAKNSH